MNLIKKLSGSFLVGLTAIGLALSTSAFTGTEMIDDLMIVNRSTNHELLNEPYDPLKCQNATETCSYSIVEPDELPDNQTVFNQSEIDEFLENGWIEENPTKGVYQ